MVLLLMLPDFCLAGVVSFVVLLPYAVMVMCVWVALIWHRTRGCFVGTLGARSLLIVEYVTFILARTPSISINIPPKRLLLRIPNS